MFVEQMGPKHIAIKEILHITSPLPASELRTDCVPFPSHMVSCPSSSVLNENLRARLQSLNGVQRGCPMIKSNIDIVEGLRSGVLGEDTTSRFPLVQIDVQRTRGVQPIIFEVVIPSLCDHFIVYGLWVGSRVRYPLRFFSKSWRPEFRS